MSEWTNFRNAVEALVKPEVSEAISFAETVASDSEAAATGNLTSAFAAGASAFAAAAGTLEVKVFAALTAFGSTLLGYEIAIVKKDAAAVEAAPVAAATGTTAA